MFQKFLQVERDEKNFLKTVLNWVRMRSIVRLVQFLFRCFIDALLFGLFVIDEAYLLLLKEMPLVSFLLFAIIKI